MRTLSWLCGSMAIAFLVAGCLLLFQPGTAQAVGTAPCVNCSNQCSGLTKAKCNGSTLCPGGTPPVCTKFIGNCKCSRWIVFYNSGQCACQ